MDLYWNTPQNPTARSFLVAGFYTLWFPRRVSQGRFRVPCPRMRGIERFGSSEARQGM